MAKFGNFNILSFLAMVMWATFNWRRIRDVLSAYFHRDPPQE
jgi:hypothetical protein